MTDGEAQDYDKKIARNEGNTLQLGISMPESVPLSGPMLMPSPMQMPQTAPMQIPPPAMPAYTFANSHLMQSPRTASFTLATATCPPKCLIAIAAMIIAGGVCTIISGIVGLATSKSMPEGIAIFMPMIGMVIIFLGCVFLQLKVCRGGLSRKVLEVDYREDFGVLHLKYSEQNGCSNNEFDEEYRGTEFSKALMRGYSTGWNNGWTSVELIDNRGDLVRRIDVADFPYKEVKDCWTQVNVLHRSPEPYTDINRNAMNY